MRVLDHPVLGGLPAPEWVTIYLDGRPVPAIDGEPVAAALVAAGVVALRRTPKRGEPRGVYCAVGRCTDCAMTVEGVPNVRTCITPARAGMRIETGAGR